MITASINSTQTTQDITIQKEKVKNTVIAICCLSFFPLLYLVGSTIMGNF
jgi:hypothetical protein